MRELVPLAVMLTKLAVTTRGGMFDRSAEGRDDHGGVRWSHRHAGGLIAAGRGGQRVTVSDTACADNGTFRPAQRRTVFDTG